MIKYIDLFAGVGGFRYGIERASLLIRQGQTEKRDAITNTPQQSVEPTATGLFSARNQSNNISPRDSGQILDCVYSNEWDKYANSVYRRHYGECDNRDIRTVEAKDIPEFDLLVGGFPCQAFSVAGKRGGFDDTRGTLFFEVARILRAKQPRLLLLENVKGLLSHDNGRTIKTIIATLTDLGYDLQWQVLNSKNHGVPQNRERIIIVGHLRGTPRPEVFPLGEVDRIPHSSNGAARPAANCLPSRQRGPDINQTYITNQTIKRLEHHAPHYQDRVYSHDGISPTLPTGTGGNHQPKIAIDLRIRRLTPIECERLQGFPDNWTKYGANGELISDTQRYKMMGNAVTTTVIADVAERLL